MAGRNGGTPVAPGLVARVSGAIREYVAGVTPGSFFSPGQPIAPSAPPDEPKGRVWDFPVSYNIQIQPRSYERVGMATLRAFADACELLRIGIETRKDQMAKLGWAITTRDGQDDNDALARRITEAFQYPDREHDWATWTRMLMEEMLVTDAPVIYRRPTKGGGIYSLDLLDGVTITRKLDETGRTPEPPSIAYQQVIKGLPAWNFTADELLYVPRNPRPGRAYGMSPTEQIMITITTSVRRMIYQMEYYTKGNVPEALIAVPASWTPAMLRELQAFWNETQTRGEAHQVKFIPGDEKVVLTKTAPLFDVGDEWLARVIMYALSLPPNAFVKQTNRATAATQQEVAMEEGLFPAMVWVKSVMDRIIAKWFGAPNLEWSWEDPKDVDPQVQTDMDDTNIKNRSRTINEVRADRGDPPVSWGNEPPAPGKPEPDPDPLELTDDAKVVSDGVSAGAAEKAAGRSLPRRRPAFRKFRL